MKKRVVVFGIFDGVHEGHRDFFQQALRQAQGKQKKGESELVVIVGRDSIALKIKNKKPRSSEKERIQMVAKEPLVSKAVLGDKELSSYKILEELDPDIICLGYDQQVLREDLNHWIKTQRKDMKIVILKPYHSEIYHSSFSRH